jgi:hypothetical protein
MVVFSASSMILGVLSLEVDLCARGCFGFVIVKGGLSVSLGRWKGCGSTRQKMFLGSSSGRTSATVLSTQEQPQA